MAFYVLWTNTNEQLNNLERPVGGELKFIYLYCRELDTTTTIVTSFLILYLDRREDLIKFYRHIAECILRLCDII